MPRLRWPVTALIQACRGTPPEPLGDGTQASHQPSPKSVESVSGRQGLGPGWPKTDPEIVSRASVSKRVALGTARAPGSSTGGEGDASPGVAHGGSAGPLKSAKITAEILAGGR